MRRREFITLLGGMAARPLAARAQPLKGPVIGYLNSITYNAEDLAAFRQGLADLGFIEGQNVTVLYRYADGQYERLPALAAELVAQQVGVIVTSSSSPAALAAKRATSTIPIAFLLGANPIRLGLVSSYNRPGSPLLIRFSLVLLQASIDRAATSRALISSTPSWVRRGSRYYTSWCPAPRPLAFLRTRTIR
jgi:putative ABC transport system substrate-binding protein